VVRLTFHGAAREVGRSCIEVETQGDRYLLDCGVKFVPEGFLAPEGVINVPELDGVLISHAHLDHTGVLPLLEHDGLVCPIFCTHETLALTGLLLKDSYKIAHIRNLHPAYEKTDIKEVRKSAKRILFDKWYSHRRLKFRFLNAGHIPGSAMILFEAEGKRVLYTGDFNTRTTRLMVPADFAKVAKEHGPFDCVITESTYGHRQLPAREELEKEFLTSVSRVLVAGGSVLIPVFALGRAQEILIMLAGKDWGCPIYFDGMAKEMTRTVLTQPSSYVFNKDALHEMYFTKVHFISSPEHRERVASERPSIIVTTSGMLQGGPANEYLSHLWHDPKSAVFLTGYQVQGTNGRRLFEEGVADVDGCETRVRCQVQRFDFSGHADIEDIKKAMWVLQPKKLIVQHGDEESVTNLVEWAKHETPFETIGPKLGDSIDL
jgi:putative mRNA 3-end processing factor